MSPIVFRSTAPNADIEPAGSRTGRTRTTPTSAGSSGRRSHPPRRHGWVGPGTTQIVKTVRFLNVPISICNFVVQGCSDLDLDRASRDGNVLQNGSAHFDREGWLLLFFGGKVAFRLKLVNNSALSRLGTTQRWPTTRLGIVRSLLVRENGM